MLFVLQVAFLRYIQQWKKKVVFVLNKSDLYQSMGEVDIPSFSSSADLYLQLVLSAYINKS